MPDNQSAGSRMQIARVKLDDAATLTEIAFGAKRHWGYPERWIESWRDVLAISPEFIEQHETYAAVVDEQLIGFYAVAQKGDRLELLHLWVLPGEIGKGVGRALFLHAVERGRILGCREMEIESDPNAEGFYLKLGARRIGSSIRELEQRPRELPILIYEIARGVVKIASDAARP